MKSIESREDVQLLVNTFYSKIRKDELLGPIFNSHISEDEWPQHLIKLTSSDFFKFDWKSQRLNNLINYRAEGLDL